MTSPPYPGVHVLYHRWQVDGRKEAPLPFMIANKLDGAGSSYYTMGDRKYPELKTYFDNIRATMSSVAALADERHGRRADGRVLRTEVAASALPRNHGEAGLREVFLPTLQGERDGRLWRSVPGRRWYSDQRGETPGIAGSRADPPQGGRPGYAASPAIARQRFIGNPGNLGQAVHERQQERRKRARHVGHSIVDILALRFLVLVLGFGLVAFALLRFQVEADERKRDERHAELEALLECSCARLGCAFIAWTRNTLSMLMK